MCTLLGTSIPRLLEPFDSREMLALTITRARQDPHAAVLALVGCEKEALGSQVHYTGSLRIQDGEKARFTSIGLEELMTLVEHGHVCVLDNPRTWSVETLNRIQFWVRNCILSHDHCAKPQATIRLPRRLIDVMSHGFGHGWPAEDIDMQTFSSLSLENSPNVRIISSSSLPEGTSYLTLSHRWGSTPSILLTKKTMFLLDGDISPYLLNCREAAVFRHAIHVTRGLGFRYIWIDALCIMQDNSFEKTADVMQMDEIYMNSTLNISAAEGRIREGLVFERNLLSMNPHRATVKVLKTQESVQLQVFPGKWFLVPFEVPLNKRGWVFQERILAPRIVHFTKNQVFWECCSLEASEVLPQGVLDQRRTHLSRSIGITSVSSMVQVRSRWYDLVEEYSYTSLTFADDRLLALSAVAKRFCSALGLDPSEYLAGMWKNDLPLSMLWGQRSYPGMNGPEPMTNTTTEIRHAPSWSWASVLGPIRNVELSSLAATTEVLDVQITRLSPNFFDGADSCRLRLRCPLCKFVRRVRDGASWIYFGHHTEFQEFNDFNFQKGRAIVIDWDTSRKVVAEWLTTFGSGHTPSTQVLLHITSEKSEDGPIERGLVLRRTTMRGTYARIGSFFTPPKSEYPSSELEDAFNGRLDTLTTDDYFLLDSDGKYTIDVI